MNIAIDVETQGLDCTKFILGCIVKENCKKAEFFTDKNELWKRVIKIGESEAKRKRVLNVYSHNASYDFYSYADLKSKNLEWFCHRPFIVTYKEERKEIIKFLDSWAIFKMPLEELGKIIGIPKLKMPEKLIKEEEKYEFWEIEEMKRYCERDARICLEGIKHIRKKMEENGIKVKRIYTINQIAINYLMNHLKSRKKNEYIMWNNKTGETRRTFRQKEIHEAYRGGRTEAFKTGEFEETTYIDCNSLYPYCATKIRFPDLRTERMHWRPLEIFKEKELLEKIGISRVMIKNESSKIGLLGIRTPDFSFYPKAGSYLIGTYTHRELSMAIEEGYKIEDIEWSVIYEDAEENPLKDYMKKLYRLRTEQECDFDKHFFKSMMNCCIGKLAQTRTGYEQAIDNIENAEYYLSRNFKMVQGLEYDIIFEKLEPERINKKYYTPIIPTLINAEARCIMYKELKKIKIEDLIYTDTDSIIFTGEYLDKFSIGKEMGEFKIVKQKTSARIFGRKTYKTGEEIKIAGIRLRGITEEDIKKGIVKTKKMITRKSTDDEKLYGKFKEETRNLMEQEEAHNKIYKEMKEQTIMIDNQINDIGFFIKKIKGIT